MNTYTCLCCLTPFEDTQCEKICKSCSESWVCKECLSEYRKHWNKKCCICKEGVGVAVEPANVEQTESKLNNVLLVATIFFALSAPIVCCYLWVAYPMGDSNTAEFALIRIMPYGFGYSLGIMYLKHKFANTSMVIMVNMWLFFGHGLYIGVSFLSESYGNIFMYYGLVFGGGIFLLMGFALGMGFVELIRKIFVRSQSILPL